HPRVVPSFPTRRSSDLFTIELDAAVLRHIYAIDHIEHGTFAGAIGPDNRANLVLPDIERNVGQRLDAAKAQRDILHIQDHLADSGFTLVTHAHAAFFSGSGTTTARWIFSSAAIFPVRPSSYLTSVSMYWLGLPANSASISTP